MAQLQANRTLSGSFASVWVDGALIAELESITGQLLPWRSKVSSSVEANPKLPSMNSARSSGRLTPARLKTKSAREQ